MSDKAAASEDGGGSAVAVEDAPATLMAGLKTLAPADQPIETPRAPEPVLRPEAPLNEVPERPVDGAADAAVEVWKGGADLVERETQLPQMDRWAQMEAMATKIARSPLMPAAIKNSRDPEADCMVMLLAAHDLGLSATVAFQKMAVIEGKLSMSAEMMRMLVRRDGHQIWTTIERDEQGRPQGATAHGARSEFPDREEEASFTLDDALAAELVRLDGDGNLKARSKEGKIKPWEAYTEDMLVARATSRLCRRVFEDCLAGVSYTPDELGIITVEAEPPPPAEVVRTTDEQRDAVVKLIGELPEEGQERVRTKFKEEKWGALKSGGQTPVLRLEHLPLVLAFLQDVKRETPEDAVTIDAEAVEGTEPFEGPAAAETAGGAESDAQVGETDEEKVARATAVVEDLSPGEVTEALGRMAVPINLSGRQVDERRALLVQIIVQRVECPTCGGLIEGDPMTDEVLCGGHDDGDYDRPNQ